MIFLVKGTKVKKIVVLLGIVVAGIFALSACTSSPTPPASDVAAQNISTAADNFEIDRQIVFFNGITDKYLLTIEGRCSIDTGDAKKLSVTCKTGANEYKKHYLGLSDNVSYFVEQIQAAQVDTYHYKVVFRPETIIPDFDLDTSGNPETVLSSPALIPSTPATVPGG